MAAQAATTESARSPLAVSGQKRHLPKLRGAAGVISQGPAGSGCPRPRAGRLPAAAWRGRGGRDDGSAIGAGRIGQTWTFTGAVLFWLSSSGRRRRRPGGCLRPVSLLVLGALRTNLWDVATANKSASALGYRTERPAGRRADAHSADVAAPPAAAAAGALDGVIAARSW